MKHMVEMKYWDFNLIGTMNLEIATRNFVENFCEFLNSYGDSDLIAGFCGLKTGMCVNHFEIFGDFNHWEFDFNYIFE